MLIPTPKIKAMIRFFASNTDPKLLGKTKLMKLFYFTDFGYVKKYASPITYDNYTHLEHGPVPSTIFNLINTAETDIDHAILADTLSVIMKEGSPQKRIVATSQFSERDKQYFTNNELEVMAEICQRFKDKPSRFIEEASHKEAAFSLTGETENISYELAAIDPDCIVTREDIRLSMEVMGN